MEVEDKKGACLFSTGASSLQAAELARRVH